MCDTFDVTYPIHGIEHKLTVLEYEADEIGQSEFCDSEFVFPTHMTAMKYTVMPDLPSEEVSVRDCRGTVLDIRKLCRSRAVISVPRSAGSVPQTPEVYTTCSGLYFVKQESIERSMSLRVKTVENVEIELL